ARLSRGFPYTTLFRSSPVPREKHHFTSTKATRKKIVGSWAKRGFNFYPSLVGESFYMIKPATTDDANAMSRHAGRYNHRMRPSRSEEHTSELQSHLNI